MASLGRRRLEARRDPLLTEKIVIAIGPQHPSLASPVQLHIQLDGELMESVTPELGFMHRGIEYLAQQRGWDALPGLLSRCEWLAGSFGDYLAAAAVEELAGISAPEPAQWLRTLILELSRLSSHLFWFGDLGLELGVHTPLFWALREREGGLDLLEELSGSRYHHGYIVPGGVRHSPPEGWAGRCADWAGAVLGWINRYEDFFSDNAIFVNRSELVGVLPLELALSHGASGPVLRACGMAADLRRDSPYAMYGALDVRVPTGELGDSLDRYRVRFAEMRECVRLIQACASAVGAGTCPAPKDGDLRGGASPRPYGVSFAAPPPGEAYVAVEGPRGDLALTVVSDGGATPTRAHLRGPSLYHLHLLDELCRGHLLADLFMVYASLDIMVGDADR